MQSVNSPRRTNPAGIEELPRAKLAEQFLIGHGQLAHQFDRINIQNAETINRCYEWKITDLWIFCAVGNIGCGGAPERGAVDSVGVATVCSSASTSLRYSAN